VVPRVAIGPRDTGPCAAASAARTPNNGTPHDARSNTEAALASGATARFISREFNTTQFVFKGFGDESHGYRLAVLSRRNLRNPGE
jgi:hypothetical protein